MSPEDRNDDSDGRESPAGKRQGERPRSRTAKSGKTKQGSGAVDEGRGADAPGRAASDDIEPRQEAGSATAERPKRPAAKRPSPRAASEPTQSNSTAPMPIDPQDELPPHGDALMTTERTKNPRPSRSRGNAAAAPTGPSAADLLPNANDLGRLMAGEDAQPHDILGAHAISGGGENGVVIRALMPNASAVEAVLEDGRVVPLDVTVSGLANLYCGFIAGATLPLRYRLRFHFHDGASWERDDAYRFLPTLGDIDLHLFGEGTHRRLWEKLGAHVRTMDGVEGVSFAVWAPNARRVSVVGDFCGWDGRIFPMRSMGASGVYELFVPELKPGALYKYEMVTHEGMIRVKTDPFAAKMEQGLAAASIVQADATYQWSDTAWMQARRQADHVRSPMSIYEVHLGSWARVPEEGNRPLSYREIAPRLADYVSEIGFTHVELMPVMEHPFYGSWGYQVGGYYAPTSRYGTPDDFRFLVDTLHQRGIGVILDWVPAHFPKDAFALARFDGQALYEHPDPRRGDQPDWGTHVFDFGNPQVRNFLVANAIYWCEEFHADGLRVDAVASMLYLDYSRKDGEWLPNEYGGRENLQAVQLLQETNATVYRRVPGVVTIAEESTAWPGVTRPTHLGGLGFGFKWNMGWMHDSLAYMEKQPVHRSYHHGQLTFSMIYAYSENYVLPISHDEVVYGKGSLLRKMPGDRWQQLANLRAYLAFMWAHPGKQLLFMGSEFAQEAEWADSHSLDWWLLDQPAHRGVHTLMVDLNRLYRDLPALWSQDATPEGFR